MIISSFFSHGMGRVTASSLLATSGFLAMVVVATVPATTDAASASGQSSPLSLAREVDQGTLLADGRWIDAPATLRYSLDPPSVILGAFVIIDDPGLEPLFGFSSDPATIELGSGPLDARSAAVRGPDGAHAARDFAARVVAFVLTELGAGSDATTVERRLGRFLLHDPAVRSADIAGGVVAASLADDWTLRFPVPDAARLGRIAGHVEGRLSEAERAIGDFAARDPRDGSIHVLSPGERMLVRELTANIRQPGAAGWLRRVLVDGLRVPRVSASVADRVARASLDPTRDITWALPTGVEEALILDDGAGRMAVALDDAPLGDLAKRLERALDVDVDAAFADRDFPCGYVASGFQTPDAVIEGLASDNGLTVERRDDGYRLARLDELDPERVGARGRVLWTVNARGALPPFASARSRIVYATRAGLFGRSWQTGAIAWSRRELGQFRATCAGQSGALVVGVVRGGGVVAIDAKGNRLWSRVLDDRVPGWRPERRRPRPVAVARDAVVLAIGEEELTHLDVRTGARTASTTLGDVGVPHEDVRKDAIVAGTGAWLVAIDSESGRVLAARRGAFVAGARAVRGGDRWMVESDGTVLALNARLDVVERWPLPPGATWGVAGDAVVLTGPDATARVIRPGRSEEIVRLGARPNAVWCTDEAAFVPCRDGVVYRVSPGRGRVDGQLSARVPVEPAFVQSGVAVAFRGYDGALTALHLD